MSGEGDERSVPARAGRGEVRELASRFFAFARHTPSRADAEEELARLRREHHDATHVAFAWRIGTGDLASTRASDAGEPPGTAGRPIASAIESSGLTDVLVAVVRHFGGTRLGTGGLARAYRLAAERALEDAGSEAVYDTVLVTIRCPFEKTGEVRRLLDPPGTRLRSERFTPEPVLELEVRRSRLAALEAALGEARLEHRVMTRDSPDSQSQIPNPKSKSKI
jgi:putative IMPACT (imprinted ancient) family translation regulator